MKMIFCAICDTNEADKMNSHLIPWFFIKKIITKKGQGERDMELSYSINPQKPTKIFAGRSILPEDIEEAIKGNEQMLELKNPYSRDNVICKECENKISRLEAIFSSQFHSVNLSTIKVSQCPQINNQILFINTKYNYKLFSLFIQSIFFRCSIGKFDGFKLDNLTENKIKKNLKNVFKNYNVSKIRPNESVEFENDFPIIVSKLFQKDNDDTTANFIFLSNSKRPLFLMLGEWTIQLFEKEKHIQSTVEYLYGHFIKLKSKEAYLNCKDKSHIFLFNEIDSNFIKQNLIDDIVKKKMTGLKNTVISIFRTIFSLNPDTKLISHTLNRYFNHLKQGKSELEAMQSAFWDFTQKR